MVDEREVLDDNGFPDDLKDNILGLLAEVAPPPVLMPDNPAMPQIAPPIIPASGSGDAQVVSNDIQMPPSPTQVADVISEGIGGAVDTLGIAIANVPSGFISSIEGMVGMVTASPDVLFTAAQNTVNSIDPTTPSLVQFGDNLYKEMAIRVGGSDKLKAIGVRAGGAMLGLAAAVALTPAATATGTTIAGGALLAATGESIGAALNELFGLEAPREFDQIVEEFGTSIGANLLPAATSALSSTFSTVSNEGAFLADLKRVKLRTEAARADSVAGLLAKRGALDVDAQLRLRKGFKTLQEQVAFSEGDTIFDVSRNINTVISDHIAANRARGEVARATLGGNTPLEYKPVVVKGTKISKIKEVKDAQLFRNIETGEVLLPSDVNRKLVSDNIRASKKKGGSSKAKYESVDFADIDFLGEINTIVETRLDEARVRNGLARNRREAKEGGLSEEVSQVFNEKEVLITKTVLENMDDPIQMVRELQEIRSGLVDALREEGRFDPVLQAREKSGRLVEKSKEALALKSDLLETIDVILDDYSLNITSSTIGSEVGGKAVTDLISTYRKNNKIISDLIPYRKATQRIDLAVSAEIGNSLLPNPSMTGNEVRGSVGSLRFNLPLLGEWLEKIAQRKTIANYQKVRTLLPKVLDPNGNPIPKGLLDGGGLATLVKAVDKAGIATARSIAGPLGLNPLLGPLANEVQGNISLSSPTVMDSFEVNDIASGLESYNPISQRLTEPNDVRQYIAELQGRMGSPGYSLTYIKRATSSVIKNGLVLSDPEARTQNPIGRNIEIVDPSESQERVETSKGEPTRKARQF